MLQLTNYDEEKTELLINGFTKGFDLGYKGPLLRTDSAENIPFTVGDKFDMWNKIMKEVQLGRIAGPYTWQNLPLKYYVQSPIGLVPKAGGKTRLIFHLSFQFKNGNQSINFWTPEEMCSVKYNDLDHAIANSLEIVQTQSVKNLFYSKTDLQSAFRIVPCRPEQFFLLCMKAKHPVTNELFIFIDKCLPFGASVSCSHFTEISEGLRHIVETMSGKRFHVTNYLDDFLFIEVSTNLCNNLMNRFLWLCREISCDNRTDGEGYTQNNLSWGTPGWQVSYDTYS